MSINAKDFTFCDKKLSDFGFMIANIDGSLDDSASCGNVELITARPPMNTKNIIHGVSYGDPIKLEFQVVKYDHSRCICSENPVTNEEQENLMRWLVKTSYNYINFDDGDVYFNVTMNVTPKKVGGVIRGFEITATNDSVYSYSIGRATFLYNGDNTFVDNSSVIGYTYPSSIRVVADANGDVVFEHKEDGRKMVIANCLPGEELIIQCENGIIQSNVAAHDLSADFNFVFLRFFNTEDNRNNTITVTNARNCTMFYRFKRMVVI